MPEPILGRIGSGAGDGAQRAGVAQQESPPDDAARTQDRESRDGTRLAVRLYWMWRKGWDYEQLKKFGSHAGQPGNRHGVQ